MSKVLGIEALAGIRDWVKSEDDAVKAELRTYVGSPLVASTVAGMTDQTKVYVYTGSETGYTAGNWYYYNGSAWTSGGVYNSTALETDPTLTIEGMAADAKATGDEITHVKQDINELEEGKADASGTSENLTAGNAEQLLTDKGIIDKVPYLLRASGGNGADREVDKIIGGTVAWNQLVQHGNFDAIGSWSGMSAWKSYSISDNILHLVSNANQATYVNVMQTVGLTASHKYFISLDVKASKASGLGASVGATSGGGLFGSVSYAANAWTRFASIAGITTYTDGNLYIRPKTTEDTEEVDVYLRNVYLVDLTQMFGTAIADRAYAMEQSTAGSGIAWLKSMGFFTADYYPYDAGTLKSVEGLTAHSMVGFNQWDEEAENGSIDNDTGADVARDDTIRCKGYIPIASGSSYCFKCVNPAVVFFYDGGYNFISYTTYSTPPYKILNIPSNAMYMRFRLSTDYGMVYNHDICINLSDPAKNGTYEPYVKHSYPLDSTLTLRGIPKLDANNQVYYDGDEYASDGTVTRRYVEYTLDGGNDVDGVSNVWRLNCHAIRLKKDVSNALGITSTPENVVCLKYTYNVDPTNNLCSMYVLYTQSKLFIYINSDNNATTAEEFVAQLQANPIKILFPVTTSTTEEAAPYQNPQILDPCGTEAYETTGIVPVGHDTLYPENLRAKIEGLPFNFATLIAPTESTYKATRAYSANNLFIVNNILYKATTSIASGGTITPGTNCTATTLAEIIAALS